MSVLWLYWSILWSYTDQEANAQYWNHKVARGSKCPRFTSFWYIWVLLLDFCFNIYGCIVMSTVSTCYVYLTIKSFKCSLLLFIIIFVNMDRNILASNLTFGSFLGNFSLKYANTLFCKSGQKCPQVQLNI